MFGHQLTTHRRRLGQICAAATRGRCLTTLLDLRAPGGDPAVAMPARTVDMWLSVWQQQPGLRQR
eukprot:5877476-Pyramimonas_sp.AAC.1